MYLAIDVGTHAVRAALISADGSAHNVSAMDISLKRGAAGHVEQNPSEIALAVAGVVERAARGSEQLIVAAGLACQRSSVLAWDKNTRVPVSPVLSWQDTRGHRAVEALQNHAGTIRQISGLALSAHYGASKISHLQSLHSAQTNVVYTPLVGFLVAELTGKAVACDETNAGRTQLWDWQNRQWSEQLLQWFNVRRQSLPEVLPTHAHYGNLLQVPGVPLLSVMGDQNAAVLGANLSNDQALANAGTGAFVLQPIADAKNYLGDPKLLHSVLCSDVTKVVSAAEGTVNGAGSALSWFAKQEDVKAHGGEAWLFEQLPRWLSKRHEQLGVFVNTVGGVGSPFWLPANPPKWVGGASSIEQRAVAIVESIVFLMAENLMRMQRAKPTIQSVVITGGLSRLDGLCQRLANVTHVRCCRLQAYESTLLGAAVGAALRELTLNHKNAEAFTPQKDVELNTRFKMFKHQLLELSV